MSEAIPRVYGTEFEYGIVYGGGYEIPAAFFNSLPNGQAYSVGMKMRKNGSRVYPDVGHAEYATPECASLDDIVAAELAGERIVTKTIEALGKRYDQPFRVHKRGIDSEGNNYGAHESYCVDSSLRFKGIDSRLAEYYKQALAIHYVSRMALVGGGFFDMAEHRWMVSQRANCFDLLANISCCSTGRRPLVDTRDEAWADATRWQRLHVSHGDPNVSPWALRTKIGMTSAFLRLIENQVPLDDLILDEPLSAASQVAADTQLKAQLTLKSGRSITALELQTELAERVLKFQEETGTVPDDEVAVTKDVIDTIDDVAFDHQSLYYKSDWYTRMSFAEREEMSGAFDLKSHYQKLGQADLLYDVLRRSSDKGVKNGIGQVMRKKGHMGPVDWRQVATRMTTPPQNTRAKLRGSLIAASQDPEVERRYGRMRGANWNTVFFERLSKPLNMPDPYSTASNRIIRGIFKVAGIEYDG